uniref:Uncharacterized protein n=1 Tax=Caenorhabditis japonica TaxID=281687 RepID=A0A8R1EG05_CAEJA
MKDGKLTVKLRNNQFLSDADYEHLFERIVLHLRHKNPSISLINAFNLTASHVIPHVLITCFAAWKNVDLETAKQIFYQQSACVLGLDPSMSIPVTDQMEELCRLACDEHQTI